MPGLKHVHNKQTAWTQLLHVRTNNAILRRVVTAAEEFRHTVNEQGGLKLLPTREPNATTIAYLNLERSLDDLR